MLMVATCLLSAVGGGVLLGVVLAALSLYRGPKPLERDK